MTPDFHRKPYSSRVATKSRWSSSDFAIKQEPPITNRGATIITRMDFDTEAHKKAEDSINTKRYGAKIRTGDPSRAVENDDPDKLSTKKVPPMLQFIVKSPERLTEYVEKVADEISQLKAIKAPEGVKGGESPNLEEIEVKQAEVVVGKVLPLIDSLIDAGEFGEIWGVVNRILGSGIQANGKSYIAMGLARNYWSESIAFEDDKAKIVLYMSLAAGGSQTPYTGLGGNKNSWATFFKDMSKKSPYRNMFDMEILTMLNPMKTLP
jgi:hypothetical protein